VLDLWADDWRRKAANGDVIIVRYADDLMLSFQHGLMLCGFLKGSRNDWESSARNYIRTRLD
jgi:hypothetical protein